MTDMAPRRVVEVAWPVASPREASNVMLANASLWATGDAPGVLLRLAREVRVYVDAAAGSCATATDLVPASPRRTPMEGLPEFVDGFGGTAHDAVLWDVLAATGPLVHGIVAADDGAAVVTAAVDMMAAHAAAVEAATQTPQRLAPQANGAPVSFLSFRSHADGFFIMCRDSGAAARRAFDERYAAGARSVRTRVSALLADGAMRDASPAAAGWHDIVASRLPLVRARFRGGALTFSPGDQPSGNMADTHDLSQSAFHQVVQRAPGYLEGLQSDVDFLGTRLLTSLLYLTLHNAGLRLVDRYFVCYAVSRAVEELFDVDAVELARGIAQLAEARR